MKGETKRDRRGLKYVNWGTSSVKKDLQYITLNVS